MEYLFDHKGHHLKHQITCDNIMVEKHNKVRGNQSLIHCHSDKYMWTLLEICFVPFHQIEHTVTAIKRKIKFVQNSCFRVLCLFITVKCLLFEMQYFCPC